MSEIISLIHQNRKICILVIIELTITFLFLNMLLESTKSNRTSLEHFKKRSEMPLYTIYDEFNNEHEFFKDSSALKRIDNYHNEMINNETFSYMNIIMQPINFTNITITDASYYYVLSNPLLIKSLQVNSSFFDNFQISPNEGRSFEADDYIFKADTIPAILGYSYHSLFKIGDIYQITYLGLEFDMEVIGFLPKYSSYIHQGIVLIIDDYIILPVRDFLCESEKGTPEFNHHIMLSMQKLGGTVRLNSHDSLPDFIRTMNALLKKHGVFALGILTIPNTSIQMLNTLAGKYLYVYASVAVIFFLLSSVCIASLLRYIVLRNARTLGILMLCGAKHSSIVMYMLGIITFLFASSHICACILSRFIFTRMVYNNKLVIGSILILVIFYVPYCIVIESQSINDLIRRSDI